jgi:hypothetical protein
VENLAGAFEKISVERALGLCRADPEDDEILKTDDERGLCAIGEPEVKAVIANGEANAAIARFLDKLDGFGTMVLAGQLDIAQPSRNFCIGDGPHILPALKRDVRRQVEIFEAIAGRESYRVSTFRGVSTSNTNTKDMHVDQGLTLNKGYAVAGVVIYPGKMLRKDFDAAVAYARRHEQDKPDLPFRTLAPWQTIIFKGNKSDLIHKVPGGRLRGLPHRSPRFDDYALAEKRFGVAVY